MEKFAFLVGQGKVSLNGTLVDAHCHRTFEQAVLRRLHKWFRQAIEPGVPLTLGNLRLSFLLVALQQVEDLLAGFD